MKPLRSRKRFLVFAALFVALPGCNKSPDADELATAIDEAFKTDMAVAWVGTMVTEGSAVVTVIEVKEWGEYNSDEGYFPLRARIAGHYKSTFASFDTGKLESRPFDHTGIFKVFKDDFGKWTVELLKRI
jgi:hypothetical protein